MSENTHIWHQHYPSHVPKDIDPDRYSSVIDLLEESFKKYKDHPAFENFGKGMTYGEVDRLSRDFAAYLQNDLGLEKGDRVAIMMPNLLQFPVAMFGVIRAGIVVVNINPLYTAKELEHQLNDSGAETIVIVDNFANTLEKVIKTTPIKNVITTSIGEMQGTVKGFIMNMVVKHVKKMVPAYSLPSAVSFSGTLKKGANSTYTRPEVVNTELAFLQYTGGTTGFSKGAMLSHRNIIANMEQIYAWTSAEYEDGKEIIITAIPLYHIFALTVNCLSLFKVGGRNILITNPRDIPGFIKELKKHDMTVFTGVNTLFIALMNDPEFMNINFSKLKMSMGGGMAVQDAVARKWEELTGSPLTEAYGLSETSPGLTANPIDGNHRLGTIGIPIPSTVVKLIDDAGNEVPIGEPGEIICKGPQVMSGYWNKEDETKNVFRDGWFTTGDIGIMSEDGFFKIVDRKKEMILVSGFNVFPNEVENAIAEHPKVLEVGCIGVPDERTTEAVKVFIVKKDDSLTAEEIKTHCSDYLTNYKRPKHVEFIDEIPKTNVGKILRRKLVEMEQAKA